MTKKQTVLLTGASGFVGSALCSLLSDILLLTPSRNELDCTNWDMVHDYIGDHAPDVIIHSAAYTDITAAEADRGNTYGECYKLNVDGTKNMMHAAREKSAYVIYISTGSVFSGNSRNQGPFSEQDACANDDALSWYACTKKEAEKEVGDHGAIIRLSHPLHSDTRTLSQTAKSDYLQKMITSYVSNDLYPLFTDQLFPITHMAILAKGIRILIREKHHGVFHMVSTDTVSPFELCRYAFQMAQLSGRPLRAVLFDDVVKHSTHPKRYTKYHAITGAKTTEMLGLPSYSWKDVVNANMSYYKK